MFIRDSPAAIVVRMRIILAGFSFLIALFFLGMPAYFILVNQLFDLQRLARVVHTNGWQGYVLCAGFPAVGVIFFLLGALVLEKSSTHKSS